MQTWKTSKLILNFASLRSLTIASIKMYFRNRQAVFFTLFMPLTFILIFGMFSSSSMKINVDVADQANNKLSKQLIAGLEKSGAFKVTKVSEQTAADHLKNAKIDLEVVVPSGFGEADKTTGRLTRSSIRTYFNAAKPQNGETATLIINNAVSQLDLAIAGVSPTVKVESHAVKTRDLDIIDFLLPGILAMSIMQLGIFSVAFAFVSMKATGMLRRIQATPTHPINFVIAQSVTRLIIGMLQVAVMLGLGILVFHFHLQLANLFDFVVVALFGMIVFQAFGFAIAGRAKDENQAAPLANLISFPMMFLSGSFFSRDNFPHWLQNVTDYLPLTYLADALRKVANEGAHLTQIGGELIGMLVWGVIVFVIAVRVFKWE